MFVQFTQSIQLTVGGRVINLFSKRIHYQNFTQHSESKILQAQRPGFFKGPE